MDSVVSLVVAEIAQPILVLVEELVQEQEQAPGDAEQLDDPHMQSKNTSSCEGSLESLRVRTRAHARVLLSSYDLCQNTHHVYR